MPATTEAQQILKDALRETKHAEIPERFWEVVDRYRAELVNQSLAITGDLASAEEVVQETFCEVFKHPAKLVKVRSVGAWLRAINKANALNRIRSERTRRDHTDRRQRLDPKRLATTGGFSAMELQEMIAKSVEKLPPKYRTVVVMRYLEERSYQEISDRLGIPEGTVGWMVCDALMRLHNKLGYLCEAPQDAEAAHTEETTEGGAR